MLYLGIALLVISAMLFCTRYLCAAIYLSSSMSWDSELFAAGLNYVGNELLYLSIAALIIGIGFLAYYFKKNMK